MTEKVLDLAEKAASYRRGGNHLLKAIGKVEEVLNSLFEDYTQFRFIHETGIAYVANLASSNVGEYGAALCYVQERDRGQGLKPLPSQWSEAGGGFYLHNDFHCWIDQATRSEIVRVADKLPDFLKGLASFLEAKGTLNEESAAQVEKIASKLREATE